MGANAETIGYIHWADCFTDRRSRLTTDDAVTLPSTNVALGHSLRLAEKYAAIAKTYTTPATARRSSTTNT